MIIAIPGSAVVMGVVLLVVSVRSFDGLVEDDYYRKGMQINQVLARDERAAGLGLEGELRLPRSGGRVELRLGAGVDFIAPQSVSLGLYHATRAGNDLQISLVPAGRLLYSGAVPPLAPGNWHLQLEADDWRLTAELRSRGASVVMFRPH